MPTQLENDKIRLGSDFDPDPQQWQGDAEQGREKFRNLVRDNAGRLTLIALGAGLGLGFLVGTALGGRSRSNRWWDRSTAESIGQRLLSRIENLVPNSVSERFHD